MTDDLILGELTPELLPDYFAFFDGDAFRDNPDWASCYCFFNHAPHHLQDWAERTAEQNRCDVAELIHARRMNGILAYLDGRVVAWRNAAPRTWMTTLDDDPEADRIGAIVCFIVASPYRGMGIASKLLEAACDSFRRLGLEIAEAYPRREAHSDAANYHGPLAMYLAAGFAPYREDGGVLIVRKKLG